MLRRWLIWTHRYVGVPVSVLFVVWFASGIVMMYTGDMPRLTPQARLDALPPLAPSAIRLTPAAAAEGRALRPPARVTLRTLLGRPVYRFDEVTLFADTGAPLGPVGPDLARAVAQEFTGAPAEAIGHDGLIERPDQWTLLAREGLPAHKFRVRDGEGTQLYVARQTGEVVMLTTRWSRTLAWLGAIPHWFYLPELRIEREPWEAVIVWTSAIGCLIAVTGLLLGIVQFRWRGSRGRRIPYAGLMRWHYLTGVLFGVATLTWTFSGLLSVQPFAWMTAPGLSVAADALSPGPLDLAAFPPLDPARLDQRVEGRTIKEIDLLRIGDAPVYQVRLDGGTDVVATPGLLLDARTLSARAASPEALVTRLRQGALPGATALDVSVHDAYDSYYYGRGPERPPLPVVRVRLDDPMETWAYIDPATERVTLTVHRLERFERWLFNGLHSLDFRFWYERRPLWDIGVLLLMAGGLASSGLGLWVGWGRVRRAVGRWRQPDQ